VQSGVQAYSPYIFTSFTDHSSIIGDVIKAFNMRAQLAGERRLLDTEIGADLSSPASNAELRILRVCAVISPAVLPERL
jgi:hypothetical protein